MNRILTVTEPAESYDLLELATVKQELGISGTSEDALLERLITESSKAAAKWCRRVFALVEDLKTAGLSLPITTADKFVAGGKEMEILSIDSQTRGVGNDLVAYTLMVKG